jgi:hypothetical protein
MNTFLNAFADELVKFAEEIPIPPSPKVKPVKVAKPPAPAGDGMTIKKIEGAEGKKIRLQNEAIAKQNRAARAKLTAHKQQVATDKPYNQATDAYNKANDAFNQKWGMKPKFTSRAQKKEYYSTRPKFESFYNKKTNTYIPPPPPPKGSGGGKIDLDSLGL